MKIQFTLNNKKIETDANPGQTLFEYLRENGTYSVKYGCDNGECGACTVIINGKAQNSCLMLMHSVNNCKIETIESFSDHKTLHPLQKSFLDEGAIQCGYCTPGMILSAESLLREYSNPNKNEIKDALAGNLCRCTGYVKPIKAVQK
jgi:aerobic-type carbon monoxide dehydrogenase small subunit (CoxS/CutS family)